MSEPVDSPPREFGGYFELEVFEGSVFHDDAVSLNTGRNALGYVLEARGIERILLPDYLCDSVVEVCDRFGVQVGRYPIGRDLRPLELPDVGAEEWLYVVNYFGQLSDAEQNSLARVYPRLIIDNTQSFFTRPLRGVDTLYTCRKFFGVADGAFLYTTSSLTRELPTDTSADSMAHVLGRFENQASLYHPKYRESEKRLIGRPLARMSRVTANLLRAVDFERAARRRRANFAVLHDRLGARNLLADVVADAGPYHYPLVVEDGESVLPQLHRRGVFAPRLWPDVLTDEVAGTVARDLARDLIPVPVDHRYSSEDMAIVADRVEEAFDAV